VCAGHPGSLPALNEKAVFYAIKAGLATNCEIKRKSIFSRKSFWKPLQPKRFKCSTKKKMHCRSFGIKIIVFFFDVFLSVKKDKSLFLITVFNF
jgi:aspartyl-tRNA(Asn)/glutamyl-tRNA(Gln) amidotransferase subunit B